MTRRAGPARAGPASNAEVTMNRTRTGRRIGAASSAALATLLMIPARALAECSDRTASPWDWDRCWSLQRVGLWLLLLGAAWLICFHGYFRQQLDPSRSAAVRPTAAYWRSMGAMAGLACLGFAAVFALVGEEFRGGQALFPESWAWANRNHRWIAVLLVGAALAAIPHLATRARPRRARA